MGMGRAGLGRHAIRCGRPGHSTCAREWHSLTAPCVMWIPVSPVATGGATTPPSRNDCAADDCEPRYRPCYYTCNARLLIFLASKLSGLRNQDSQTSACFLNPQDCRTVRQAGRWVIFKLVHPAWPSALMQADQGTHSPSRGGCLIARGWTGAWDGKREPR
jgi:hypothetical protein